MNPKIPDYLKESIDRCIALGMSYWSSLDGYYDGMMSSISYARSAYEMKALADEALETHSAAATYADFAFQAHLDNKKREAV